MGTSWTLLCGLALALGFSFCVALARRRELVRMEGLVRSRENTSRQGSSGTQLMQPVIDLSRCLGCGTCVASCPEGEVLALVHGQAVVVNGARCVGHALCERECPVGAITVTLANLAERRDVPILAGSLEAHGSPGLFLAGEVTAHALIKNAIEQGMAVASEVGRRGYSAGHNSSHHGAALRRVPSPPTEMGGAVPGPEVVDLCIVGAGPAGLACGLEAKRLGLAFVMLEQEESIGGTVAKYPRRKLVLTQPVELPLFGRLDRTSYEKEELVELWRSIAERAELPIRYSEVLESCDRSESGEWIVRTTKSAVRARNVCLALGRRGMPRKLGVPGEELAKVAYGLLDAHSYTGRRILVVGGGDCAVETALALAEQDHNEVVLAHRGERFPRIRARNEARLNVAVAEDRLRVLTRSELLAVHPGEVELAVHAGAQHSITRFANDEVFVQAGGTAPFELLERSGVSFDPALREPTAPLVEQGTGLVQALGAAFVLALVALSWAIWNADYYALSTGERATHTEHEIAAVGPRPRSLVRDRLERAHRPQPALPRAPFAALPPALRLAARLDDQPRRHRHPGLPVRHPARRDGPPSHCREGMPGGPSSR